MATVFVWLPTAALAADQTVLGKRLAVVNPGGPAKRKVTAVASDGTGQIVVGDPTADGGALEILVNGGSASSQAFVLPQAFWSGNAADGYKYLDAHGANGPVRLVKIKRRPSGTFSAKAKILGALGPLSIVPPNPGTDGCVAVTLTGGDRYSIEFGPTSRITNDGTRSFNARNPTAAALCPTVPIPTTSTSTSSTTSTTVAGACAADDFLDVSSAPGPGGVYSALKPSLSASCGTSTVTVQSNGIPTYEYQALTPNGLQAKSYTFTFPRYPAIAGSTTPVPLLGNMGVAVNGIPIYSVNEGAMPASDAYGDPIAAAILDPCGSHSAQMGTFHNHKLVVKCLLQSAVSESQPWNDPDPSPSVQSPIIGYAFDGFPIYGPYECTDLGCSSVQEMASSWDSTGYEAGTAGCVSSAACSSGYCTAVMIAGSQTTACVPKTCVWSNNTYSAKVGAQYLDQCNGHTGPGGDYHYHATATFPYIVGCYKGTPTNNGGTGTPPGGTCP